MIWLRRTFLTLITLAIVQIVYYYPQIPAVMANLTEQPRLHPSIGWALAAYFVILLAWLIHFYLHFRKP